MRSTSRTDEDLLSAPDARSFEEFYLRHVDGVRLLILPDARQI